MDDIFHIEFAEMEEDGEKQWFWDFRRQALFESDKQSRQLRCLFYSSQREENRYLRTVKYKNKIFMLPVMADEILIYDISKEAITKMPLPTGIWNEAAQKRGKFGRGIIFDRYLILLPSWSDKICKIDMEQEEIVVIKDISKVGIMLSEKIPFGKAILENEYIYTVAGEEPILLVIDANTLEYSKKTFDHQGKGFCSICRAKDDYWLFPKYRGDIIKWNFKTDKETRYTIPESLLSSIDKVGFSSVRNIGNSFWLFPETAPEVLKIDAETGKIKIEEAFKKYSTYRNETDDFVKYWMIKTKGSSLQVYSAVQKVLVEYDIEKKNIKELPYYLSNENRIQYFMKMDSLFQNILIENMPVRFLDALKIICRKGPILHEEQNDIVYGRMIYNQIVNKNLKFWNIFK